VTSSVTTLAVVTPSTENGEGHNKVVCLTAVGRLSLLGRKDSSLSLLRATAKAGGQNDSKG
jgi:hypothetical protein